MNDQIICPHCKKPIPLTQALSHELKEKLQKEQQQQLEVEKKKLNEEAKKWRDEQLKKLEERVKQEAEYKLKDAKNEAGELKKQNTILQEQLLELSKLLRQMRTEREQEKVEFEKKLSHEQEKIKQDEKKRIDEEYRLKILEKDKKLNDAMKLVEDYKRKLEQGSQQLQGEVLELELENILRKEFPYDEIKEVPKGVRGADILQVVRNNYGKFCGTIIWESKRTRAWSNDWLAKLKEDQRAVNAEIAVIVSNILPNGVNHFGLIEDVWVCSYQMVSELTMILRDSLIKISAVKSSMVGKEEKKEILWNYLTSTEFQQRLSAIVEAHQQFQEDIEKEKRWFALKWAKQEKNIRKVIDNILGVNGDLESIIGKALPEIKGLEMLPSGKDENETLF